MLKCKDTTWVVHYCGKNGAAAKCEYTPKGINVLFYWGDILSPLIDDNETVVTCAACLGTKSNGPPLKAR